jgi:AcrR family transcriptional regulator
LARRPEIEPITRDRILAVTAEQMAQRGFRGTNLNDVATQLGVTKQALYYHFANNHAILSAIFEPLLAAPAPRSTWQVCLPCWVFELDGKRATRGE